MSNMIEVIRQDMVKAMKSGDNLKRNVLRVLKGELDRDFITKDVDVLSTIKKMVSNLKESNDSQDEIEVLKAYLPKQMTESEMEAEVEFLISGNSITNMSGMGMIMAHFKSNHPNQYDGKTLSSIVKSKLS